MDHLTPPLDCTRNPPSRRQSRAIRALTRAACASPPGTVPNLFTGCAEPGGSRSPRSLDDRHAAGGHRALGGGHRQLYGGHRQLCGGHRQLYGGHRQLHGGHRQQCGGHRQLYGGHRQLCGGHRQQCGGHRQLYGGHRQLRGGHPELRGGRPEIGRNDPFGGIGKHPAPISGGHAGRLRNIGTDSHSIWNGSHPKRYEPHSIWNDRHPKRYGASGSRNGLSGLRDGRHSLWNGTSGNGYGVHSPWNGPRRIGNDVALALPSNSRSASPTRRGIGRFRPGWRRTASTNRSVRRSVSGFG